MTSAGRGRTPLFRTSPTLETGQPMKLCALGAFFSLQRGTPQMNGTCDPSFLTPLTNGGISINNQWFMYIFKTMYSTSRYSDGIWKKNVALCHLPCVPTVGDPLSLSVCVLFLNPCSLFTPFARCFPEKRITYWNMRWAFGPAYRRKRLTPPSSTRQVRVHLGAALRHGKPAGGGWDTGPAGYF